MKFKQVKFNKRFFRNVATNKIEITSQNDLFALDVDSLKGTGLVVTHKNVLDGVPAGIMDSKNKIIAVQYNPSDAVSPEEYVFNRFKKLMKKNGGNGYAKKN